MITWVLYSTVDDDQLLGLAGWLLTAASLAAFLYYKSGTEFLEQYIEPIPVMVVSFSMITLNMRYLKNYGMSMFTTVCWVYYETIFLYFIFMYGLDYDSFFEMYGFN